MTEPKTPAAETPEKTPWEKLREPFPPEAHGKKPQPLKKNADKGRCDECGKTHGLPAIHIDYVNHGHVTARLLEVDPAYTLKPLAVDALGQPAVIEEADGFGIWAVMTVLGTEKIEYGIGGDRKAAWSDVLKRCAMRHGVAVDVWMRDTAGVDEGGVDIAPEDTFGACPRCHVGKVVKRTKKDGEVYAKCSLSKYKDATTCQWIDWSPDFDALVARSTAAPTTGPTVGTVERQGTDTLPRAPSPVPGGNGNGHAVGRADLQAALLALPGEPRMTILSSFGYRSNMPLNGWLAQLDDDVAGKLAEAIETPA